MYESIVNERFREKLKLIAVNRKDLIDFIARFYGAFEYQPTVALASGILDYAMSKFKPREISFIVDRYVKGITLKQLSEKYNLSASHLDNKLMRRFLSPCFINLFDSSFQTGLEKHLEADAWRKQAWRRGPVRPLANISMDELFWVSDNIFDVLKFNEMASIVDFAKKHNACISKGVKLTLKKPIGGSNVDFTIDDLYQLLVKNGVLTPTDVFSVIDLEWAVKSSKYPCNLVSCLVSRYGNDTNFVSSMNKLGIVIDASDLEQSYRNFKIAGLSVEGLEKTLRSLTIEGHYVIEHHFKRGESLVDIAKDLGVSVKVITKVRDLAFEQLSCSERVRYMCNMCIPPIYAGENIDDFVEEIKEKVSKLN